MDKDQVTKLIEGLQSDLKTLILETKKKYPTVKEVIIRNNYYCIWYSMCTYSNKKNTIQACEEVLTKVKFSNCGSHLNNQTLRNITNPILYPLIQGCETKDPKLTKVCLQSILNI